MEKQAAKSKNKILSFLPKAAQLAAVSFQNPSFSPRPVITSHKLRTHNSSNGFSGPILFMIPYEARRKTNNYETTTQEPTSPKVSCIGQIKHKNRIISNEKHASLPKEFKPASYSKPDEIAKIRPKGPAPGPNQASGDYGNKPPIADRAPCLSQMRRFASGRESTLANFDWATAVSDCDDKDDVIIPLSVPSLGGGLRLEPRKEINLWKRRTMAQPEPLQLSTAGAQ